jgi:hypothetical protein
MSQEVAARPQQIARFNAAKRIVNKFKDVALHTGYPTFYEGERILLHELYIDADCICVKQDNCTFGIISLEEYIDMTIPELTVWFREIFKIMRPIKW